MIRSFLVKILVGAAALWIADYLLVGFAISGGLAGYLVAGAALGLLNTLVRPLLKLVSLPLIALTFGLFTVVINAAMLLLASYITGAIVIASAGSLFLATLIVSFIHSVL